MLFLLIVLATGILVGVLIAANNAEQAQFVRRASVSFKELFSRTRKPSEPTDPK